MIDTVLTALGLTKGATIGAFFGAIVSLKFIGELTWWQGACALFCGTITAAFISPLVMEMSQLSARTEGAISFLIGVFGMVFGASVVKATPEILTALKERFIGGGK